MAKVTLEHPFAEIHGSITKSGLVNRQKKYRDDHGRVIHEGKQEAYSITHPRDFKKTPKTGAELANHNLWKEACRRASQIIQAGQPGGPTEQQLFSRKISQIPIIILLKKHKLYLLTSEIASKHSSQTLVANTPIRKRRLTQKLVKANATLSSLPSSAQSSITPSKHRPLK